MIYLISQILLCLALAALLGGALGWLLQRSRGTARLAAARRVLAEQARRLERAQTDVTMLTDDFDDLRERSRVEIDALRQENRAIPALTQNLEKSQLLVRQMIQRHDSQVRELETSSIALKDQIAQLQEQVVTRERALAEAAKAAKEAAREAAGDAAGNASESAVAATLGEGVREPATSEAGGEDAPAGRGRTDADTRATPSDAAVLAASPLAHTGGEVMANGDESSSGAEIPSVADGSTGTTAGTSPDGAPVPTPSDASASHGHDAPSARRGWASLPAAGAGEAGDELLDEVMELDDDFAAELRGDVDATADDDLGADARLDADTGPDADAGLDANAGSVSPGRADGDAYETDDATGDDAAWDEDEDGNATLAIEVFSMDDVHGVDGIDAQAHADEEPSGTPSPSLLFRPVDRQDDLKRLFGIGAVTEKALNELGITSYPQLAELERPEIEKIAAALEIGTERIERDDWVGNARRQLEDVLEEL